MTQDIKPFGHTDLRWVWVKKWSGITGVGGQGYLELVAIDEFGKVTTTRRTRPFDERAPTQEEAVTAALGGRIAEADADLERRPPPPEPAVRPMDPATQRFLAGDDW